MQNYPNKIEQKEESIIISRIIAIWGFNEAAFGGILHALKIPFTGLFIGSIAVMLITLIAHYSKDRKEILKATVIVLLVKGIVSPHTPVTAYLAVMIQGVLGYIIFSLIRFPGFAAPLLGFLALLFSAFQKLIVTTIFFGTSFWKSIDLFAEYVFRQFGLSHHSESISASLVLIISYTLLHIAAGIAAGYKALQFPSKINSTATYYMKEAFGVRQEELPGLNGGNKKKSWWKKPTRIALFLFLTGIMLLTYFFPMAGKSSSGEILFMIIRAAVITLAWYFLLSMPVRRYMKSLIEKNKFKHTAEIENITNMFPQFRKVIGFCWKNSEGLKGIRRIRKFISDSIVLLLIYDSK